MFGETPGGTVLCQLLGSSAVYLVLSMVNAERAHRSQPDALDYVYLKQQNSVAICTATLVSAFVVVQLTSSRTTRILDDVELYSNRGLISFL